MNRQRRQEAKKKQRERQKRAARQRRFESDHSRVLVWEADAARFDGDHEEARRLLEKAVRLRPGSQDAHLRLAELCLRRGPWLEGLQHYEQLTSVPAWPELSARGTPKALESTAGV